MSEGTADASEEVTFDKRLAMLLAMAMFVLVVDTSLMNVSISAVVHDLGTTVSSIQSAINGSAEGATITIGKGTYVENVVVDKPVKLVGYGKSTVIEPARPVSGIAVL